MKQDKFLACLESHQLDIDTSDLALSTLSKVSKFAARTRIKVRNVYVDHELVYFVFLIFGEIL